MSDAVVGASGDPLLDVPPDVFIKKMEPYERVLVELKEQLYEGSWDRIVADLKNRLEDKPYVFRLSNAIERDLKAIERLKMYEVKHAISLALLLRQAR